MGEEPTPDIPIEGRGFVASFQRLTKINVTRTVNPEGGPENKKCIQVRYNYDPRHYNPGWYT